jgi:hypothetical protein
MNNTHTPAPWSIEWDHQSNTPEFIRAFVDGEMEDVAIVTPDTPVANARLISAAPDLLSALEFLLADYIAINGEKLTGSIVPADKAREAIRKAKGEA